MLKHLPALALVIAVFVGACTSGPRSANPPEDSPPAATSVTAEDSTPMPEVVTGETLWPLNRGDAVGSLMGMTDTILLGRVLSVALPYDPRPGYLGWTPSACPFPPDHPKFAVCSWTPSSEELLRPPGRGFTIYAVQVLRAIGSSLPDSAETVYVRQPGGIWEGVANHMEGDALLELGKTYLLSLDNTDAVAKEAAGAGRGYTIDVPFSRFIVDSAGKLQPVDKMWASMPAVQALSGRTTDEALSTVQEARAGSASPAVQ